MTTIIIISYKIFIFCWFSRPSFSSSFFIRFFFAANSAELDSLNDTHWSYEKHGNLETELKIIIGDVFILHKHNVVPVFQFRMVFRLTEKLSRSAEKVQLIKVQLMRVTRMAKYFYMLLRKRPVKKITVLNSKPNFVRVHSGEYNFAYRDYDVSKTCVKISTFHSATMSGTHMSDVRNFNVILSGFPCRVTKIQHFVNRIRRILPLLIHGLEVLTSAHST